MPACHSEEFSFLDGSVDCLQFRLLITPAVDGRLEGAERLAFDHHAQMCSPCRRQFELELSLKERIHDTVHRVPAPSALRAQILDGINDLVRKERARLSWPRRLLAVFSLPGVKPAAIVSVTVLSVLFVVLSGSNSVGGGEPLDRNIMDRSLSSYHALKEGTLAPQIVSDNPMRVQGFLAPQVECPVEVPMLRDFTLVGGLANDFRGIHVAQVMYRRGGTVLALIQIPLDAVVRNRGLSLPLDARNELVHNGWYSDAHADGEGVVLWTRGTTLCVAVAGMGCLELRAVLHTSDDSTARAAPW
jgi:anti-sigma factor RsiW